MKTIFKHIKNSSFTLVVDTIDTNIEHQLQVPTNIKNQKKIIEWINSRQLIKTLWPEFTSQKYLLALKNYINRKRRFGGD